MTVAAITSTTPTTPRPQAADEGAPLPIWRESLAGLDWLALRWSAVYAARGIPRGDGAPVVLVPGLLADDSTLLELRGWLRRAGYTPHLSRAGYITGCPDELRDKIERTVERAASETGRRVRVVGHSLGGLLARGVALKRPDLVAQVITLGAPVNGFRAHPAVAAAARFAAGAGCDGSSLVAMQAPLARRIDEVNVYTETDGVVDPATAARPDARAVVVRGTHLGLIVNPQVYRVLAEALAAPEREDTLRARVTRYRWMDQRRELPKAA